MGTQHHNSIAMLKDLVCEFLKKWQPVLDSFPGALLTGNALVEAEKHLCVVGAENEAQSWGKFCVYFPEAYVSQLFSQTP